MFSFLQDFAFDGRSFLLGLLSGILLWVVLLQLKKVYRRVDSELKQGMLSARKDLRNSTEVRLGNDILRFAQSQHLAASLFSLDEILIPPEFLAPPVVGNEEADLHGITDVTEELLPYMPDWPEMAVAYGAPRLTLAEALSLGADLVLIGPPGSGKSVALAHLAIQVIRRDPACAHLNHRFPLLVHAAEFNIRDHAPTVTLGPIIEVLSKRASALVLPALDRVIRSIFENQRALLLVDGLDELTPEAADPILSYLDGILQMYSNTRCVLSAQGVLVGKESERGLMRRGFAPIAIAPWNIEQRQAFLNRWGEQWSKQIAGVAATDSDPLMLAGWLRSDAQTILPFDLTLKAWAAYAGDSLGPSMNNNLEAYLRRCLVNRPGGQQAVEALAANLVLTRQSIIGRTEAEKLTAGVDPGEISGLFTVWPGDRRSFSHPLFAAALASKKILHGDEVNRLVSDQDWIGKSTTLRFLAYRDAAGSWVPGIVGKPDKNPLGGNLFTVARWLSEAPKGAAWVNEIMKQLVAAFNREDLAKGVRARALAALVASAHPGTVGALHKSIASQDPFARQMAALGIGYLREVRQLSELTVLLKDKDQKVRQAACQALVATGDKAALEAVASALMHGDEVLRRFAAEAMANHRDEGHPTLQEGANVEDVLIRRAVIFGLARLRKQDWALKTLQKIQSNERQWVVQNAASETLHALSLPKPHIPVPLPTLSESPWLIQYAAKQGMGVIPGKPANNLLYRCLKDGSDDQKIAALYYLGRSAGANAIVSIYECFYRNTGEVRETALVTLWQLACAGLEMPLAAQYGYQ